jgi:hypothetical protein
MTLFAGDFEAGLVGAVIGGGIAAIAVGLERAIRALGRWLFRRKTREPGADRHSSPPPNAVESIKTTEDQHVVDLFRRPIRSG